MSILYTSQFVRSIEHDTLSNVSSVIPTVPIAYHQSPKKIKKHYTITQTIVFAKTGEFLLGFYEDTTVTRFEFFKICKENGQENPEFERETENKRVQEEK